MRRSLLVVFLVLCAGVMAAGAAAQRGHAPGDRAGSGAARQSPVTGTWVARASDPEAAAPGWRPFEDAFPTFYQFTNRPR